MGETASATTRRLRRRRRLAVALGAAALLAIGVIFASDVDASVTDEDRRAIAALGLDDVCGATRSFEDELACVRALQARLLEAAPEVECVHEWGRISHEPAAFLERERGCCYDRSRLVEKALAAYGFEVRHVSIHKLRWPAPFGYLQSVPSHAISEVRTSRGWMVVDSNRPLVGIDPAGRPLDAAEVRDALRRGRTDVELVPEDYFHGDYTIFYGLYSRHGGFYPPFLPVPDIDWAQMHHNL